MNDTDKTKGHCQLCGWEGVLTKNGRMRTHKGDPEKGLLESGNCPSGSDLPREAVEPVPVTESGGPNPHRAPLAPDAPLGQPGWGGPVKPTYDPDCETCNTGTHRCPGCGDDVPHGTVVCADCQVFYADDPKLDDDPRPTEADVRAAETFMLTAPADVPDDVEASADNILSAAMTYGVRPEPPDPDADAAGFLGTDGPSEEDDAAAFFDSDDPEQDPGKGRWFESRYDGECDNPDCQAYFSAGDEIRRTEDGYQGRECCGQAEDDGVEAAPVARPKRVSPKPPMDKNRSRYRLRNPLTGKAQSYSRVTTWVKAASDHYALGAWQLRSCVVGLAKSPELLKRAEGLDVKEHAKALNLLAEDAKNAAGAKDKASIGTKVHKWTEELDAGHIGINQVPEEFRDRCAEYLDVLRRSGCTVLPHLIERTTVEPELGVVGTFDQAWGCPDGVYRIVDKKTGAIKYDRLEIEAQLAIYARGANRYGVAQWDPALGDADDPSAWVWAPLTDNEGNRIQVSETSGIVIHMPQDGGPIRMLEVDLARGWEHAQLCRKVKASQKLNPEFPLLEFAAASEPESEQPAQPSADAGAALLARVVPSRPVEPEPVPADFPVPEQPVAEAPEPRVTWASRFAAVRTKDEARELLKAARDAGMPKERQDALIAVAQQALRPAAA